MEKFYSPMEVADMLSVTRETVYKLIKQGKLNAYKFGGVVRITEEQLKSALEGRVMPTQTIAGEKND